MVATTAERWCPLRLSFIFSLGKSSVISVLFFTAGSAAAADWKLVPTIGVTETYTDNVRLAKEGTEQSAFVTQFSPSLTVMATGQRLKLQANYVLQNSYYSGSTSETKTNHLLSANAQAALIQDLFFLDGNANISQQNLSPFGQVSENNFNLSNNRVEVKTYSISPFIRRNFDNEFTSELRYGHDSVSTGSLLSSNSRSDSLRFSLNSGIAFKTINWGVNYSHQNTYFDQQRSLTTETATVNAGYQVTPLFRLTSTAGHESNSYVSLGDKPPGGFWTLGFVWNPTQRTNVIVSAGQRFYGKTQGLTLNHRARMSVFSLGYSEDVTTTRGQFLVPATNNTSGFLNQLWQTTIPDATTRQQTIDNFIRDSGLPSALAQPINTFSNQVFLQKSLQGSIALNGAQNTVVVSVFNTLREPLSISPGAVITPGQLDKNRQIGINALWNWRLSSRTNANLSLGYVEAKVVNPKDRTITEDKNISKTFRASISRQLQPKLKATLEARHLQGSSNLLFGNYTENAITLYLFLGF